MPVARDAFIHSFIQQAEFEHMWGPDIPPDWEMGWGWEGSYVPTESVSPLCQGVRPQPVRLQRPWPIPPFFTLPTEMRPPLGACPSLPPADFNPALWDAWNQPRLFAIPPLQERPSDLLPIPFTLLCSSPLTHFLKREWSHPPEKPHEHRAVQNHHLPHSAPSTFINTT